MPANIYTVFDLCAFEHQERLQEAARNRLAASAQQRGPSLLARMRTARLVAASWLSGQMRRMAMKSEAGPHIPWSGTRRWRAAPSTLNAVQESWALAAAGLQARRDQTIHQ